MKMPAFLTALPLTFSMPLAVASLPLAAKKAQLSHSSSFLYQLLTLRIYTTEGIKNKNNNNDSFYSAK